MSLSKMRREWVKIIRQLDVHSLETENIRQSISSVLRVSHFTTSTSMRFKLTFYVLRKLQNLCTQFHLCLTFNKEIAALQCIFILSEACKLHQKFECLRDFSYFKSCGFKLSNFTERSIKASLVQRCSTVCDWPFLTEGICLRIRWKEIHMGISSLFISSPGTFFIDGGSSFVSRLFKSKRTYEQSKYFRVSRDSFVWKEIREGKYTSSPRSDTKKAAE